MSVAKAIHERSRMNEDEKDYGGFHGVCCGVRSVYGGVG